MKIKDAEAITKAMRNSIKSNNLEGFYGEVGAATAISKALGTNNESSVMILCKYLEATKVPKYVRLATFLREFEYKLAASKSDYIEQRKTEYFLKDEGNAWGVYGKKAVTIAKEFAQIEKRGKIAGKKAYKKLNKYKDVRNFWGKDARHLYGKLTEERFYSGNYPSSYYIDSITEFFDECQELQFLNKSKLTKKVI